MINAELGLAGTGKLLAPILGTMMAAHPQTLGITVTKEMLLDLNAELNKIKI